MLNIILQMEFKIRILLAAVLVYFSNNVIYSQEVELSKASIDQLERGYGMFIHFGLNTFNEIEWSKGDLPPSSYNPTELDCDQWVRTAKEAGFRYVILITKHHDGFCLWDSKYTDYDVASSPVKTDVVSEVAKACKKYGIKLGLYYSLWDRHEPSYKDTKKYLKYMKNQLTELMTNYGEICELWFDGGWGKKDEEWNLPEVYKYVKKMQPNCLITVNHTIGWHENRSKVKNPTDFEKGDPIRYFPVDFRIKDPNLAKWDDPKYYEYDDELHYLPFEHTICISDRWNWFQKKNVLAARPLDELESLFYWCTANNNVMIINIPPDNTGKIRTNERLRILALADRLGIRGGETELPSGPINKTFNQKITASSAKEKHPAKYANDTSLETYWVANDTLADLEIEFDSPTVFDRVGLFEKGDMKSLGDGFSKIRTFKIKAYELHYMYKGVWDVLYIGDSIGACKIINLPEAITAEKIKLKITQADKNLAISHVEVSLKASGVKRTLKNIVLKNE